jgi:hypothetical protein
MLITAMRASFVQFELLASPLYAKTAPSIPFSFLLNGPGFRTQFASPIKSTCRPPWDKDYARSFWKYYAQFPRSNTLEIWRAMVPLEYPLFWSLKPSWEGDSQAKAFLYPWGIGILVDVSITGKMQFDDAINKAVEVRRSALTTFQASTTSASAPINKLLGSLFDHVRAIAFGTTPKGVQGELFTVVTFVDGEGDDLGQAIQQSSTVHKGLEGLVGWNDKWNKSQPPPLAASTLKIRGSAPVNHLLYGSNRGRAVWFPEYFASGASDDPDERLPLYHQNLSMAALHTESLCLMARDVANQFDNNRTPNDWSFAYADCAKRVAGILGRLYGGTTDTYRSRSVQNHIQKSFKDTVNAMRTGLGMSELKD